MAQVFHRSVNFIARLSLLAAVTLGGLALTGILLVARSPCITNQRVTRAQPLQFSHKHHAGDDGIDCRYCHTSVETSSFAGIPPTKTCMNCHRQIWADSPALEPVRDSFRTGKPIKWTRVNALPDFVYFNHSIHVNKGVGCSTCHGRVDQMPLTWQVATLQMRWCLDCHRNPESYVRPKDKVFDMSYEAPPDQEQLGQRLMTEYNIRSTAVLISCDTCHR